ncbi:ABC transporter permease [Paenibacillus oryzisoli]|uniref:Protein lplB n=1 Tax=Paenibacillus oryzisoli TaxID=1850517 RepID=A0A198AHE1_9BACL|nr:ABC transporter permease subunit [Paenibacillus oryzisoli]OAS20490.1 protein lplB [Paenibacillus oryzisoli]
MKQVHATALVNQPIQERKSYREASFLTFVLKNRALYIMLLPGILFFLVFRYVPLIGSVIAFKDYNIFAGIWRSEWVGFQWFEHLFTYPQFSRLIKNTLLISLYQIVFAFPAPILIAVLMNELKSVLYKRTIQTVLYLPHFLSWAIIYGLAYMMFSEQAGMLNQLVQAWGGEKLQILQSQEYFRTLIVGAGVWKEMGWSAIIFLAALAGISPSLYEAAKIDGANRWKQFLHITLPGLLPAISILLLLKIGNIMDVGFEQVYVFLTPLTIPVGDVLDTYSYRMGIISGQYSLTTAIGIFKSVIGFVLLVLANKVSKSTTGEGLY